MPYHADPPRLASVERVVMLIVPPIEGDDMIAAPSPRCVCMLLVTSLRPAQLLQYTLPFSMSLTGTPFAVTATHWLLKPRMRVSASP